MTKKQTDNWPPKKIEKKQREFAKKSYGIDAEIGGLEYRTEVNPSDGKPFEYQLVVEGISQEDVDSFIQTALTQFFNRDVAGLMETAQKTPGAVLVFALVQAEKAIASSETDDDRTQWSWTKEVAMACIKWRLEQDPIGYWAYRLYIEKLREEFGLPPEGELAYRILSDWSDFSTHKPSLHEEDEKESYLDEILWCAINKIFNGKNAHEALIAILKSRAFVKKCVKRIRRRPPFLNH